MTDLDREAFTVQEAMSYLGVSRSTIYSYIRTKLLPVYRMMNHRPRFLKADLDRIRNDPPKRGPK